MALKRHLRAHSGFTLTEMMIVVAITGIIMLIGPALMLQVNRFLFLSRTRLELQREARVAISIMSRMLRQAQHNTIRIDRAPGQPYYSRITFTKKQGTVMSYYQNGKKLIQTTNGKISILTENVRYLAFTFPRTDDMTIVSVAMTLEKGIYEGKSKAIHMASEKIRVMN